jgi:hypothetical protein
LLVDVLDVEQVVERLGQTPAASTLAAGTAVAIWQAELAPERDASIDGRQLRSLGTLDLLGLVDGLSRGVHDQL